MKKKALKLISLIIYIIAMIILTLVAIPFMKSLREPEKFQAFINGFGAWSFLIMLFMQIAQVIVALIPGEVVEFLVGTLYGWFGGLIFCLFGVAVGQALIFSAVRFFGKNFVENIAGSKAMGKLKFLKNEKKLKIIIFLLFFIPGTPKDLLTYVVPLTSISLRDFLIITLFARIPSIVSSTFAGSAFVNNDFKTTLITYAIILIISVIGMIAYNRFESKINKKTTS